MPTPPSSPSPRSAARDPRLLRHARTALPYLLVCVVLGIGAAACVIAQSWLLARAIATVSVPAALPGVVAVRALLTWGQEAAAARTATGVTSELRRGLLLRLLTDRPDRRSGELAALVTRGVDALGPCFSRYLPQLVLAVTVPVAIVVAVLTADPGAALILVVTLPLIPMFGALIGSCAAARTKRQWRTLEILAGHFADVVAGLPTLKIFGRARAQAREVCRVTDEHRGAAMGTPRLAFCSALVLEAAATLSVALVAVSVGLRLVAGSTGLQTALFVLILAPEAYLPLRLAGTHFHAAQEGFAAADRILGLLERAERVPGTGYGAGRIEVEDVVVRPGGRPVSLRLEPGLVTVLTGPSGSGKSSLLAALLGLAEPVAGRILVGGVELADPGDAWRRRTAWLPQRPFFLAGSVADNIAIAVPGARATAVRRAAELTGVTGFTSLERPLGEGGAGLSAGQRQRMALARVALRCELLDVGLLLLDEPTAHLDPGTELELRDVIAGLAGHCRTAVVVTHRRALLGLADQVVRLESGPVTALAPVPA